MGQAQQSRAVLIRRLTAALLEDKSPPWRQLADARVIGFTRTERKEAMMATGTVKFFNTKKGLWVYRAERRQQGRVRAHQRGGARRHAHPGGRPEGQLRHRDRPG